jgi:hypothetical protein
MEKAWAKLNGSYGNIIGGLPHDVLNSLTKAPTVYSRLCVPGDPAEEREMEDIWRQVLHGSRIDWVFCTGTTADPAIEAKGLVPGHAYTLLDGFEVNRAGSAHRLVKLRNPWGKHEWTGRANDHDTKFWAEVSAAEKKRIGYVDKDNGEFFMVWADFLHYYDMIDICKIDDSYSYNFINFDFTSKNAAFCRIETKRSGRAHIGLHQPDNRGAGEYIKSLGFARATLVLAKSVGGSFRYVAAAMEQSFSDCYLEADLEPGCYVLYAKLEWPRGASG